MVDVTLSSPNPNAFNDDVVLWPTDIPIVITEDNFVGFTGGSIFWRAEDNQHKHGSASSIATYSGKYRTVDAVYDEDGVETSPAEFSTRNYFYMRFESEEDWDTLLAYTNPIGIMPGGTKIEYATGLTVDPSIGNGDGTYGIIPSNGIQLVWA